MVHHDERVDWLAVVIAPEMLKNDCAIVKALDQGDDHEGGNDEPPLIPVVQREWKSIQIAECIELEHGANVGAGIVVVLVEAAHGVDVNVTDVVAGEVHREIFNLIVFHLRTLRTKNCSIRIVSCENI